MMSERDRHILKTFAARLRQRFPKAEVWAFGSRARGDAREESDLDLCVVVEGLRHEDRQTIRRIGWEVGFEQDVLLCTTIYSKDDFEWGPCSESPLVMNIRREGIPVS
jgi:predicted nucleotidyltransferase